MSHSITKSAVYLLLCLVLACAPSLALAAGGGGAAKAEAKSEAKNKKRDASTITGGQGADDPIYLHMSPVTLPIINDYGAQQLVTMLIDLEAKDMEKATTMQKQMPKLKDAILQALYGGLADGSMRNAQALDIPRIKQSITDSVNRIFGNDYIHDAFILAVSQRKL